MSTIGMFRRVSQRVVDELFARPERVRAVLYPSTNETAIDDDVRIDVDTAWHALHFLLSGSREAIDKPLGFILGGTPVGDDLGDGPARVFTSTEVRRIAAALALINVETLRGRFAPDVLQQQQIYPAQWNAPGKANTFAAIAEAFDALKDFVTTTAQAEAGMIVYLM